MKYLTTAAPKSLATFKGAVLGVVSFKRLIISTNTLVGFTDVENYNFKKKKKTNNGGKKFIMAVIRSFNH